MKKNRKKIKKTCEFMDTEKHPKIKFVKVYYELFKSGVFKGLSELFLWSFLYNISSNKKGCYAKRETLGEASDLSDIQVGRVLQKLVDKNLLWKETRIGQTNVYRLLKVDNPAFKKFKTLKKNVCLEIEEKENGEFEIIKQYVVPSVKKDLKQTDLKLIVTGNNMIHDLKHFDSEREYNTRKDFTSVKNAEAKVTKQENFLDNENPCLTKARSNYVDNIKSDSCPEEILPYIKYWENNKYKSCSLKRNSKTFKQTSEILLSMIDGSFFTNKNQKPGYKLTLSDFTKSVNNYYESLKIENRDPRRPVQTYSLITFLWNWNARTIRCPFLKYLNFTVRTPDLSIIDTSPKLTKYIIDKYKRYIKSLSYTPLADELDKFKSASNRLYKYFIDNKYNLMLDKDFQTQVDILFESIIESLPEGIKVNPGHLCSNRTFLRALPEYLKKYEMVKDKQEDNVIEYKMDLRYKESSDKKAKQELLEAQDWY